MELKQVLVVNLLGFFTILLKVLAFEPYFTKTPNDVSFIVGQEANLVCSVNQLGNYKIAWIKVDTQTILSVDTTVITNDPRIQISHDNRRNWMLHIADVKFQDRGYYMCQMNTQPMRHQTIYLDAVVPPNIIEDATSSNVAVKEHSFLTLHCQANGYPSPTVCWQREDGNKIDVFNSSGNRIKVTSVRGTSINITRVTRFDTGTYLCMASNGVPPPVSKRITLQVNFRPTVMIANKILRAPLGAAVNLECIVEASPTPSTTWTCRGKQIKSNKRYQTTVIHHETLRTLVANLLIRNATSEDFGTYECLASNIMGQSYGKIRIYESRLPHGSSKQGSRSVTMDNDGKSILSVRNESFVTNSHSTSSNDFKTKFLGTSELSDPNSAESLMFDITVPALCLILVSVTRWHYFMLL